MNQSKIQFSFEIISGKVVEPNSTSPLEIHFWGRTKHLGVNELLFVKVKSFRPYFFEENLESGDFLGFNGKKYQRVFYRNTKERKNILHNYETLKKNHTLLEIDINPLEQFLMDFEIFGIIHGEFLVIERHEHFLEVELLNCFNSSEKLNTHPEHDSHKIDFSLMSFDIETSKKNEVISLAYVYRIDKVLQRKVLVLKNEEFHKHFSMENIQEFEFCDNQKILIEKFFKDLQHLDPDFVLGWNVVGFDFHFLFKKCQEFKIPFSVGRLSTEGFFFENLRREKQLKIPGRVILDGPKVLKTNFFNFESYSLNFVSQKVLNDEKDIDEDEVIDKWGEIERRYREDVNALVRYNLKDAELVLAIFDQLHIMNLLKGRVQVSGLLYEKIGGSTASFDHYLIPFLHKKKIVAPNIDSHLSLGQDFSGGLVIEPIVGLHDNVIVLDFRSLYPSVIATFKIDPYSLLMNHINPVHGPSNISFSRTENFFPDLILRLMEKRLEYKKKKLHEGSQAVKILMNSFYGVMGSNGSRFMNDNLPRAITMTGQWILSTAILHIKALGFEVIYGDTDSIFIKGKSGEKDEALHLVKSVNEHLQMYIKNHYQLESYIEIQFDKMFKKFLLTKVRNGGGKEKGVGAKKRYAGVLKGGEENMHIVGMEFVRSDWSPLAKKFQYELLELLLREKPEMAKIRIEELIKEKIEFLKNAATIQDLTLNKRMSKRIEDYQKMMPPHVQAAKIHFEKFQFYPQKISYVMTKSGAMPSRLEDLDIDFEYYIEKQLKPIAESLLDYVQLDFDSIVHGEQLSLFSQF